MTISTANVTSLDKINCLTCSIHGILISAFMSSYEILFFCALALNRTYKFSILNISTLGLSGHPGDLIQTFAYKRFLLHEPIFLILQSASCNNEVVSSIIHFLLQEEKPMI